MYVLINIFLNPNSTCEQVLTDQSKIILSAKSFSFIIENEHNQTTTHTTIITVSCDKSINLSLEIYNCLVK